MDAVRQLLSNHLCLSVLHYNSKNIRSINLKLEHIVVYGIAQKLTMGIVGLRSSLHQCACTLLNHVPCLLLQLCYLKKCHLLRFKLCKECERVAFSKKKVRSDISF